MRIMEENLHVDCGETLHVDCGETLPVDCEGNLTCGLWRKPYMWIMEIAYIGIVEKPYKWTVDET